MAWKYRVKGWNEHFESAKSRTYKHKRQSYMPNKHGLGYRAMVRREKGPALFGAWCAMIQTLSRQADRHGYLTDTSLPDGIPIGPSEISLATDIPEDVVAEMLEAASSQAVGWLEVNDPTDTTRTPQGYHEDTTGIPHSPYPLPLPLPLPLPSPGRMRVIWEAWTEAKIQDAAVIASGSDVQAMKTAAQNYEIEQVVDAINKYAQILGGEEYLLKTHWTLAKFLEEHMSKFLPGSKPEETYGKSGAPMKPEDDPNDPRNRKLKPGEGIVYST